MQMPQVTIGNWLETEWRLNALRDQNPARVDEILSGICASNNDTSNMIDSQSQDIVEIRCILRDARNAISADAADTAIQLIDEADNKLVSVGVDNNESSSNVTNTSAIN